MLNDEGLYEIVAHPIRGRKCAASGTAGNGGSTSRSEAIVFGHDSEKGRQARIPTVVITALGTGRYRGSVQL